MSELSIVHVHECKYFLVFVWPCCELVIGNSRRCTTLLADISDHFPLLSSGILVLMTQFVCLEFVYFTIIQYNSTVLDVMECLELAVQPPLLSGSSTTVCWAKDWFILSLAMMCPVFWSCFMLTCYYEAIQVHTCGLKADWLIMCVQKAPTPHHNFQSILAFNTKCTKRLLKALGIVWFCQIWWILQILVSQFQGG